MSRAIYADIPHDFKRRMENWARWAARDGDASLAPSSMWSAAPSGARGDCPVNTLGGEAEDTQRALYAIPQRDRQAVMLFWQYQNQPLIYLARRCSVDYRTYEKRVIYGHVLLRGEIFKHTEATMIDRERFEQLSAA